MPWPARRSPCASSMTGNGRPTKAYPVGLGSMRAANSVCSLPLVGEGWGGGDAFGNSSASIARPPPPTPPHKGEGSPPSAPQRSASTRKECALVPLTPSFKAAASVINRLHAGPCRASLWRRQSTTCSIRCSLVARIARCRPVLLISTTRFAGRNLLISSRSAFPLRSFSSSSHRPLAFASTSATP
jgi:hypothetical protein